MNRPSPTADKLAQEPQGAQSLRRRSRPGRRPSAHAQGAAASQQQQARGTRTRRSRPLSPAGGRAGRSTAVGGGCALSVTRPSNSASGVPGAPKARPHRDDLHTHIHSGPRGRTHAPTDWTDKRDAVHARDGPHVTPGRKRVTAPAAAGTGHTATAQGRPRAASAHSARQEAGGSGWGQSLGVGRWPGPAAHRSLTAPTARLRWATARNVRFPTKHTRL